MTSRELNPAERMVDAFDRANTLTFTVIAEVRGALDHAHLERALRVLERRHPLLRAQVVREGDSIVFSRGEGVPIPLTVERGDAQRLQVLAAKSIEHRAWPDAGPRAELTWLEMGEGRSALLLTLHHLVSDGSSGMLAMRDLLTALHDEAAIAQMVESPGLHAFLPKGHGGVRDHARAFAMIGRAMTGPKPQRLREGSAPPAQRSLQLRTLSFDTLDTERLIARARRDGATVHGVLCGAIALAVAERRGVSMPQRITHPVDMRRYLRQRFASSRPIGECVGYYVSSVDTDHVITPGHGVGVVGAQISRSVAAKKAAGEPLLTAPIAGPLVTRMTQRMSPERFCALAERDLMLSTFSVTNLGHLEQLGLRREVGSLRVEDVWFVAAGSVLATLGASATTFGGRLRLAIGGATPVVSEASLAFITDRVTQVLGDYAHHDH